MQSQYLTYKNVFLFQSPKVISGDYCECKNFGCPKVKQSDTEECGGNNMLHNDVILLRHILHSNNMVLYP